MVKRIEHDSGIIQYIDKNKLTHKEDGPAIIWPNGDQYWYINDELHREDGPSVILSNGEIERWLNGHYYRFNKWCELISISDEEKIELILRYG